MFSKGPISNALGDVFEIQRFIVVEDKVTLESPIDNKIWKP